jgi:predicted Kef-type K+ transport protein
MHDLSILITFAVGLAGALLFGYIAVRLNVSPIIGYLLAGVAVGPFTPGVVVNHAVAEQFAEIGVILLLFGIGLRFHLRELLAVWRIALSTAQSAPRSVPIRVIRVSSAPLCSPAHRSRLPLGPQWPPCYAAFSLDIGH